MNNPNTDDKKHLFDNPRNVTLLLRVFYVLCALLFGLDFVLHRHIYTDIETIPAFYALYGFVACVVLVIIAKYMRTILMRDEEYYDPLEEQQPGEDK